LSLPTQPTGNARNSPYRDPDEALGREREYARWFFVLMGAAGDAVAFYIVVGTVFNKQPALIVLFSSGFASVSIGLAHAVGTGWARLRGDDPKANRALWLLCLISWLFLGAVAFLVRLSPAATIAKSSVGYGAAAGSSTNSLMPALLFVALFFASGACAICAAYVAFNPLYKTLRRAVKRLRQAVANATSSASAKTLAERDADRYREERARERQRWLVARRQAEANMAELQNYARHCMAVGRQNAPVTEGLTADAPRADIPPQGEGVSE
jgi:hypothetical protein